MTTQMSSQLLLGSTYEFPPLETGQGASARTAAAADTVQLPKQPEEVDEDRAKSGPFHVPVAKEAPDRHPSTHDDLLCPHLLLYFCMMQTYALETDGSIKY